MSISPPLTFFDRIFCIPVRVVLSLRCANDIPRWDFYSFLYLKILPHWEIPFHFRSFLLPERDFPYLFCSPAWILYPILFPYLCCFYYRYMLIWEARYAFPTEEMLPFRETPKTPLKYPCRGADILITMHC